MLLFVALAAAAEPVVSQAELAAHATPADCWLAIDGGVYNVTTFLPFHPGGPVLGLMCGRDATALFHARPGKGTDHSDAAQPILHALRVGRLEGGHGPTRRELFALRARSTTLASVLTPNLPPAHALRFDLGHELGGDDGENNIRFGFSYGISDKVAVELVHATLDGESDVGVTVAHGTPVFRGGVHAGVGYRRSYGGVGIFAELPLELRLVKEWITLDVTPGLAVLPEAERDGVRGGGGVGLTVRPTRLVSVFGEAHTELSGLTGEWAVGVRLHTVGHTFALWGGTGYAMTPLDRLVPGQETSFAMGLSLSRDFALGLPPLMKKPPPPGAPPPADTGADLLGDIPAMPGAPPPPPAEPPSPEPAPVGTPAP